MNKKLVERRVFMRMKKIICHAAAAAMIFSCAPAAIPTAYAAQGREAVTDTSEDIGFVGNLFCIADSQNADHAELQWSTTLSAKSYTLYRSENGKSGFEPVYEGNGASWQDNSMEMGKEYFYQLAVHTEKGDKYSEVRSLKPCETSGSLDVYDNQHGSNLVYETSGTKVGDKYYSYSLKSHAGQNDIYLAERVSTDGVHFGQERTVADSSQNPDLASCKIESVHIEYAEKTGQIVVWAHWEKPSGYSDGKALVITGTPGGNFKVHHVYNPLDIQVRDMAVFFDDDGTGYLIAAANKSGQGANATIYIFKMNEDYSGVTEVVKKLHEDQYREFPNMIKKDGYYFLFTSQAAGWYPSSGAYTVTKDLYGEWSGLRSIGNSSTFSSQSGWIVNMQDENYLMHAYRWLKGAGTSGTTLCPLYFDNGFAFYDYCPTFRYSTKTGELYPVQEGELLSQDKPASSSLASNSGESPSKAFDGSYQTGFKAIDKSKKWPFYLQVDLESVCELSNIQTSWFIYKGSEAYYTYTVEGSLDGQHWEKLLDRTNKNDETITKTYGFNSDMLSGKARYVRLNVQNATLQNNPNNNWYTPNVFEVKVFGKKVGDAEMPSPAVHYDFENVSGGKVPDISGNGNDMTLSGSASAVNDGANGNVLNFDGNADTYGQLPDGILDGCREYTISMDAVSQSEGDFFTFAQGQDKEKYVFFKVAKDHFRFQTTTDTWRGETGLRYDLDGTVWHNYTLSVSGAVARLYVDGELVSETSDLTTGPADMGSKQNCLIGKSYYPEDVMFTGKIDNLQIYKCALTDKEVKAISGGSDAEKAVKGDVNGDGAVNSADLVMLQKYLHGTGTLTVPENGDLIKDGTLDVFDIIEMRKLLIK